MCGLSGEIRFDGARADAGAVRCMSEVLAPRGPDGSGEWARGPVALAHRRLAIIDLSEAGAQPMLDGPGEGAVTDDDADLVAVFNGCVYNYPQLREELAAKGHRFRSTSDTEVILKAYRQWGDAFVEHLVGMFAVVLHEVRTGRVVMARDRLGIKPLYLAESDGAVRFASSLPALVAAGRRDGSLDNSVDPVALHHYLSWHAVVPAPRTVLRGVRKLPPATVRVYEPGSTGEHTDTVYWQPRHERDAARAGWSARDWEDAVEDALRTAVRRRLVADVPVGVLLSGGLDSSLIVGLLAEEGQSDLATFSIGFDAAGGREGDEFQYSDVIAAHYATDHHKIAVDSPSLVQALPHAIGAMSEPMVSHDVVAFDLLCEQVSRRIRVVQSGQGADEVFAGYHWYPPMAEVGAMDAPGAADAATDRYARAFFDRGPDGPGGMDSLVSPAVLERMLAEGGADASRAFVAAHLGRPGAATAVDAALRLDTEVMLVDDPVKRVDNTSMAWGLEARVPFLDHDLVELAATVPPELKLADGGKGILKAIGRRTIPTEVIDRPKGYFPVPALTHLEGGVLDLVRDALTDPAARRRGLFRPEAVAALVDDPNGELTPLKGNRLWQLGLLELWLQAHGVD